MSEVKTILNHEGRKYLKPIRVLTVIGKDTYGVDVYAVLEAFKVTCPATAHAVKKLLCAGERGKGSRYDDLIGALAAINRAVELEQARNPPEPKPNEP